MTNRLVELRNVTKSFGSIRALDEVNLYVDKAEIVGLIGDNGAGKSTLIKILSGVHAPDSGEILVKGEPVSHWNAAKAHEAGIETVYQDRALAVQHSIARNIFMGREITNRFGAIQVKKQHEEANRLMREIGFTSKLFSPETVVATLSGGERQGVAIARAMYFDADLIILDEPTTALSLVESEKVFNLVRTTRDRGSSVVFISHNILHAYDIADRFIILDRGQVVMEAAKSEIPSAAQLIQDLQHIAHSGRV